MTNVGRGGANAIAIMIVTLAAVLVSSCAARSKSHAPAATKAQPESRTQPASEDSRSRIRALSAQIERWQASDRATVESAAAMCTAPQPKTPTCQDVCRLKGSICSNAATICELAGNLPGDAWAADQCSGAKAACERATKRCCGCVARE